MEGDPLAAKRQELAQLSQQLDHVLGPGLLARMKHASWYLTGVQIGLRSLQAYYEIAEMVYREHTAHSEGGERLANLRNVYNKLTQFAHSAMPPEQRTRIMLEIRQPLQRLLREFRGWQSSQEAMRQRATIISQLASDVRMSLIKLRSFEKMQQDIAALQSPMFWLARGAKKKAAERVKHDHIGYASTFGFNDPDVLMDNASVKDIHGKVERATRKLETQIRTVHQKLYSDRYADQATGDLRADLAENRTVPILQQISKAGFEYLDRAHSIYEHALQLQGLDGALLQKVTEIGAEIEEADFAAASRQKPSR